MEWVAWLFLVSFIISTLFSTLGLSSVKKRVQQKYPKINKIVNGFNVSASVLVSVFTFFFFINDVTEQSIANAKISDIQSQLSFFSKGPYLRKEVLHESRFEGDDYVMRFVLSSKDNIPEVYLKIYGKTLTKINISHIHRGEVIVRETGVKNEWLQKDIVDFSGTYLVEVHTADLENVDLKFHIATR